MTTLRNVDNIIKSDGQSLLEGIGGGSLVKMQSFHNDTNINVNSHSWWNLWDVQFEKERDDTHIACWWAVTNLWEGSEQAEVQVQNMGDLTTMCWHRSKSANAAGWALYKFSMNYVHTNPVHAIGPRTMQYRLRARGIGTYPRFWWNYPTQSGNDQSQVIIMEFVP